MQKNQMRPKAYSYIRMSSEKQLSGDSLRRQLQNSRDYAAEHNLDLDETLRDLGVSAYTGDNVETGALGKFLQLVKTDQIAQGSYLIIESLDRLSRKNVLEALPPFLAIINAGIVIVTLADKQVYSSQSIADNPYQLMGSLVVMIRANEESATKSKRVKEALGKIREAAMAGEGRYNINLPRWIDAEKGRDGSITYSLNEHAGTIRLIYEWAAEGIGQMAICRLLTERGIPPFKRAKLGWHQSTVGYLLQTPAVIGTFAPRKYENKKYVEAGPSHANYFPAAIDNELYARVQRIKRTRVSKGRKGVAFSNLFMGMTVCASCQGPMTVYYGGTNGKYKYLRCYNRLRTYKRDDANSVGNFQCTNGKGIRYDDLEKAILDDVPEYKLSDIFREGSHDKDLEAIATRAIEIENEIGKLQAENLSHVHELTIAEKSLKPLFRKLLSENTEKITLLENEQTELNHQRIDIESAKQASNNIEQSIEDERRQWPHLTGEELYRSRNRTHNAYKRFLQMISFDPVTEIATVIIANGYRAYRFKEGRLIDKFDAVESGHMTGEVGSMTAEHFAGVRRDVDGEIVPNEIAAAELENIAAMEAKRASASK